MLANWDRIKREVEGRGADDPFADVPENLPGLLYARKMLRRAEPDGGGAAERETRDEAEAAVGGDAAGGGAPLAPARGRPRARGPGGRRSASRRAPLPDGTH